MRNICFIFILLVAIGLRFFRLGEVPVSLYWDEVAMLVDAKAVADTGKDMHGRPWFQVIYPSYGDYKQPVYIWLAAVSVKIFGADEWAVRLPSAIAGVMTAIVAGMIAHRLLKPQKKTIFLSTMLVVALSPWSIMFSRTGFEGHVAQLLLAVSILLLVIPHRKWWQIILAAVLGALATYAYFSVRFVWPVVAVMAVVMTTQGPKKLVVRSGIQLVVAVVIFALSLVPMMKSPLYAATNTFRLSTTSILNMQDYAVKSNQYRELASNQFIDRVFFHREWLKLQELALNYADHLNPSYLFLSGDPNLRHGTKEHGLFLSVLLLSFVIGIFFLFDTHKKAFWLLVVWWLIALLPAAVPDTTPHALRSLNALVPVAIIIGSGLGVMIEKLWRAPWQKVIVIGYLALVILCAASFSYHYFTQYPVDSADAWQAGYKETAVLIDQLQQQGYPVYVNHFDERFYLWLMAYGSFSGQDFHSWASREFRFQKVGEVIFGDASELTTAVNREQKLAIVAAPELLAQLTVKPAEVKTLPQYGNQPARVIAIFNKP